MLLQLLPDEWEFSFYRGKLAAKMGAPAHDMLHHMADSCRLALSHKGGQTEPLYRLHATRLKLLLASDVPPLAAIAAFPFLPETKDRLESEPSLCFVTAAPGVLHLLSFI